MDFYYITLIRISGALLFADQLLGYSNSIGSLWEGGERHLLGHNFSSLRSDRANIIRFMLAGIELFHP